MIKNIPNKYTQNMLLETVEEGYKGKFDFFYLPIDFQNKCNVGYAFINFIDPSSVNEFFLDFSDKKWKKFNSSKVCVITFARIQGKQSNIEHFRNSSLMHEDEKYRPLLFHSTGAKIGLPESFPEQTSTSHNVRHLPRDRSLTHNNWIHTNKNNYNIMGANLPQTVSLSVF